jgi:hypothetical protein
VAAALRRARSATIQVRPNCRHAARQRHASRQLVEQALHKFGTVDQQAIGERERCHQPGLLAQLTGQSPAARERVVGRLVRGIEVFTDHPDPRVLEARDRNHQRRFVQAAVLDDCPAGGASQRRLRKSVANRIERRAGFKQIGRTEHQHQGIGTVELDRRGPRPSAMGMPIERHRFHITIPCICNSTRFERPTTAAWQALRTVRVARQIEANASASWLQCRPPEGRMKAPIANNR